MKVGDRLVRGKELLRLVADVGGEMFAFTKREQYRRYFRPKCFSLDDYFPSELRRIAGRLARRGWVRQEETLEGLKIILTDGGREEILFFQLEELGPKTGNWDGRWRVVFFDICENDKKKRNKLRKYLKRLGMYNYQKSVWISPYDCDLEVKYIREVLDIPHEIKTGLMIKIENEEELKGIFGLK